jgi:hypothetical protein
MIERNDSLLREVDEELRREQIAKLWDKYGVYALIGAAIIVLAVGGFKYWEARQLQAREAAGARFLTAIKDLAESKANDAQTVLESISKSGPAGYAILARLRLAAADAKAGKLADAVAAYDAIANQGDVDPMLADFARFQAAMLRLDTADWTELQNRLNGLTERSAWRYSAREALGLAALRAGKTEEARQLFEQILADRATPPSIAERARTVMAMLTEAELTKRPEVNEEQKVAPTSDSNKAGEHKP